MKRHQIATAAAVVALCSLGLGVYVRGTSADDAPRDPKTPGDGYVRQILATDDGGGRVRCAVVLDHPAERVYQVITDYDHFTEIFQLPVGELRVNTIERRPGGVVRLVGESRLPFVVVPLDLELVHTQAPDGTRRVSWDASSDPAHSTRGGWTVTPRPDGTTLLVYALEVREAKFPQFLVNNVVLSQIRPVVSRVGPWLDAQPR